MEETQPNPVDNPLSNFGARINDIEERQRLIKDRVLLIGKNLIETKEELNKEEVETKNDIKKLSSEISSIKVLLEKIITEMSSFGRKSEIEILERQFKMFEPFVKKHSKE